MNDAGSENQDRPPLKRFEVKMRTHPGGEIEKDVFIDGERLNYSIDTHAFLEARKMGPVFMRAVQEDIAKHFTEAVSEFLGRKVTVEELQQATRTGWI